MANDRRGMPRVTKKHLARAQRERIMRNWILAAAALVVALVGGLLVYGWAEESILNPRRAVAVVNGEEISSAYLQARYLLGRESLLGQANQIQQLKQIFGTDPSFTASLDQQLSQIENMLADVPSLRRSVLDSVVDETLIRQEAKRRGIVVSPEEVDAAVQEAFGFYPNGTPTPATHLHARGDEYTRADALADRRAEPDPHTHAGTLRHADRRAKPDTPADGDAIHPAGFHAGPDDVHRELEGYRCNRGRLPIPVRGAPVSGPARAGAPGRGDPRAGAGERPPHPGGR